MTLWQDYHLENPRLEAVRLPYLGYHLAMIERWFVSGEVAGNNNYTDAHHYKDLIGKLDWLHEHQNDMMPIFHRQGGRYTDRLYLPRSLERYNELQRSSPMDDNDLFENIVPYFWNGETSASDADDLRTWGQNHNVTEEWLEGQLGENIILESNLPKLSARYNARWLEQRTRIMKLLKWGPCPFKIVYSYVDREYKAGIDYNQQTVTVDEILQMVRETCLYCDEAQEMEANCYKSYAYTGDSMWYVVEMPPVRIVISRGSNINVYVRKVKRIETMLPINAGDTPTLLTFFTIKGETGGRADDYYAGTFEENKRYFLNSKTMMENMFAGYVPPPGDISYMSGRSSNTGYIYGADFRDMWCYADYTKSIFKFKEEITQDED